MPTNLTNNTITSTYNQLLHVSDGPTSSLKTVYSGTGTATALKVSTLAVAVDNLQFDANTISSTNTNGDIYLTPNGTGQVTISNANFTGATTFTGTTINGGNLRMTSNTLSSTNTNGNVIVAPNGTGDVQLDADTVRMGDANVDATLTTNGTGDMIISTNSGTNSGVIRIFDGVNGNITLTPNGTGDVVLSADTVQIGDSNVDATLTTSGTGDLILNTNSGTSSGTIRIYDGVNGNIDLTPNGTGTVNVSKIAVTSGTVPLSTITGLKQGMFYSTADQTATANTATAVTFNNSSAFNSGVTVVSSTQITVDTAGTYEFTVSIQFANSDAADHVAFFWYRKNGTDIVASSSGISVPRASYGGITLAQVSIMESMTASQYIEVYWATDNAAVTLDYTASIASPYVRPATPSVILLAKRVA